MSERQTYRQSVKDYVGKLRLAGHFGGTYVMNAEGAMSTAKLIDRLAEIADHEQEQRKLFELHLRRTRRFLLIYVSVQVLLVIAKMATHTL